MPGQIDGLALANLARAMRPELGIVIVSGRVRPALHALAVDAHFMAKPFSPLLLASLVRELTSRRA